MNAPSPIVRFASLFRSNRSQAVRIPKDLQFPENVNEVIIRRHGPSLLVSPRHSFWTDFFGSDPNADFPDRDPQPAVQERDEL